MNEQLFPKQTAVISFSPTFYFELQNKTMKEA